ncbi:UNVERIFIED_CONTAM: Polygalacturonase QRT3 [Sesamum latifolium]|uniref:Polygalacturonase QRT3 n=1 Tax=Sesamum latifolium TaxID=2727402 RepID=A0AAW2WNE9_9LAMI
MDFNSIVMEDPDQVLVSNGFFLGDGNIVLRSIQGRISGLNIVNNIFCGDPNNMVPIVKLEGIFTSIDQVVIDHNVVNGMSLKSTVSKLTVVGMGQNGGVAAGFPAHAVTNVSNNMVVIESQEPVNAVVSISVDQYNMIGDQESFVLIILGNETGNLMTEFEELTRVALSDWEMVVGDDNHSARFNKFGPK